MTISTVVLAITGAFRRGGRGGGGVSSSKDEEVLKK